MNEVVFDLETKKDFSEVGGRKNHHLLGVSVAAAYDYAKQQFFVFEEEQLTGLESLLAGAERIIGFNIKGFDYLVLQPHLKTLDLVSKPTVDLMEETSRYLGYRPSLNALVQATLGQAKSGTGSEALQLYKEGKMEELKNYCQNDVRLTKELYEFGKEHGKVFIMSKDGVQKHTIPVKW